jgi:hypothetical protein
MYRRLHACAVAVTACTALSGCVQATRHSNTMLFGTNTHLGIRAGASASSVPEVNIGYARQEAVVMPLVANSADNGTHQSPCNIAQPVSAGSGEFAVHPCLLVGINGKAQDSYSVLASFGAKFDGQARPDGSHAKGGLAQYFATGVAAQMLALKGGAAVVAVGEAAAEAAENSSVSDETISALYGGKEIFSRGRAVRTAYDDFRDRLLAKIALTSPADVSARITAFETGAGVGGRGIAADCTDKEACRRAVIDNTPYLDIYEARKGEIEQALAAWKVD